MENPRTDLVLPLALSALQPQDQLLGGLGLLPQDRLRLTTESLLLAIVPELSELIHFNQMESISYFWKCLKLKFQ